MHEILFIDKDLNSKNQYKFFWYAKVENHIENLTNHKFYQYRFI